MRIAPFDRREVRDVYCNADPHRTDISPSRFKLPKPITFLETTSPQADFTFSPPPRKEVASAHIFNLHLPTESTTSASSKNRHPHCGGYHKGRTSRYVDRFHASKESTYQSSDDYSGTRECSWDPDMVTTQEIDKRFPRTIKKIDQYHKEDAEFDQNVQYLKRFESTGLYKKDFRKDRPNRDGREDMLEQIERDVQRNMKKLQSNDRDKTIDRLSTLPRRRTNTKSNNPPRRQKPNHSSDIGEEIQQDIVTKELSIGFDDIGGLDDAKQAMNEAVVLPLVLPEFFTGVCRPWRGVLLFGPPGNGKTLLAKAMAGMSKGITFFNCSAATLTSKWRGDSEKALRSLFTMARRRAPSILFFDEIDSLMSMRGSGLEHESSRRFKSEFLIHMDGLLSDGDSHILVLATSNAPWDLDEALRRRLQKRIYVPLPDFDSRCEIFQRNLAQIPQLRIEPKWKSRAIKRLADLTSNYSGSDIELVCREAIMRPLRKLLDGCSPAEVVALRERGILSEPEVCIEDLLNAINSIAPSVSPNDIVHYERWSDQYGSR